MPENERSSTVINPNGLKVDGSEFYETMRKGAGHYLTYAITPVDLRVLIWLRPTYMPEDQDFHGLEAARSYESLWDPINGADAWEAKPWLTAYPFTVRWRDGDA